MRGADVTGALLFGDRFPDLYDMQERFPPSSPKRRRLRRSELKKRVRLAMENAVGLEGDLVRELGRCFGTDDLRVLGRRRRSGGSFHVRLAVTPQDAEDSISYELAFGTSGPTLTSDVPERQVAQVAEALLRDFERAESADEIDDLLFRGLEPHIRNLLGAASSGAYYLPADRTGVMHSHQVVVGTLVQHATTAGLRPSTTIPMLSGCVGGLPQPAHQHGQPHSQATKEGQRT